MRFRPIVVAILTAACAAVTVTAATPASAATYRYVGAERMTIHESTSGRTAVLTGIFQPGDHARINCWDQIWAGVWLTGKNGPDGWADPAPNHFPMPGVNGGRSFAAIGRFVSPGGGDPQPWRHVGTNAIFVSPHGDRYFEIRTNDDRPGNGDGAFVCYVNRYELVD